ncbi:DUF4037 domain-containing protein [Chengkuizengella marina]|uniref:DUF4037 domain-containing protein n=1 Tax=Chengkuizengella marina TaxID=2507566 RepID=A0A6N9Q8P2_9BACL|nr:DUF4037 domain-containing protein [Chengkuizengella marina]NBI31090.1 DUF4037 domain-containing protein [Chengkuizengella marina]
MLVGSSSRSYRDVLSDYDVEVVVTNEYYSMLTDKDTFYENEEHQIEFLFFSEDDFKAKINSCKDVEHWPYEECTILYDPQQRMDELLTPIIMMDPEVREQRLKLHYFEFLFGAKRIERTMMRGNKLNTHLVTSQMLMSLIKLLFLLKYKWPPLLHWTFENLNEMNEIPVELKQMMTEIIIHPDGKLANSLIQAVDNLLTDEGADFHYIKTDVTREISAKAFRPIREKYSVL